MKFYLIFWFSLLGITGIHAQSTFRVEGKTIDFHNSSPLANAEVRIGNHKTVSDAEGIFVFKSIPEGLQILTAKHPDCDVFTEELTVDRPLRLTIKLEHHATEIEEVQISSATRSKSLLSVSTLSKEDISQNSSENLGNLLRSISGVSTLKTGNNIVKPVIHGLYGSRILIFNNGVRMAEQEWGTEHAPSIETTAFNRINVVKGAGMLKYGGDAAGGTVLLEPRIFPAKDTLTGNATLSFISNGRGVKTGVQLARTWENRWFVTTGGTYKKLGDLYIPHHTLQNTGAEEHSLNFSFGKRSFMQGIELSYSHINQEFGIFRGAHLGGSEDFYRALSNEKSVYLDDFQYQIQHPKQEVAHHIAKMEMYKRFYNAGKFSLQYAFQLNHRKEYDIRRGEYSTLPSMDLKLMTHNLKFGHLLEREKWQIESGIEGNFQDNFPDPSTQARRLIPDYLRYDAGIFSVFQYQFSDQLKAEAGLRYDFTQYDAYKYYDRSEWDQRFSDRFPQFVMSESGSRILVRPQLQFHNIVVNAGIRFTPSEIFSGTFNLSRTSRTPNAAELFADGLHHSAAIIEKGDLSLQQEVSYHINLSAATKLNILNGLQLEVSPYLLFSDNFINQLPTGIQNSNRGVFMIWDYQQTRARIFGVDADLELGINDQLTWISRFSALRGDDLENQEPLILMMPANFRNSIEWKSKNNSRLFFKLENETVLKQNRFPIRNQILDVIENGAIVSRTLDTSSTPSAYSLFHFSAGMGILKNFNINVTVNNLLNTEYRDALNRLRYFAPELGRSLILTLHYQF